MTDLTSRRGLGLIAAAPPDTLDATLRGYAAAGLLDLFAERVMLVPADTEAWRGLAARHGFAMRTQTGTLAEADLAEAMRAEIVLLCDGAPLCATPAAVAAQIAGGTQLLLSGRVQLVRLRLRGADSERPIRRAYRRFHGRGVLPVLRRTLRPGRARLVAGGAPYAQEENARRGADRAHRGLIDRADDGTYLVAAGCLPFASRAVLLRRTFLTAPILEHAQARGARSLDAAWHGRRWRTSGWQVGVPDGLFGDAPSP